MTPQQYITQLLQTLPEHKVQSIRDAAQAGRVPFEGCYDEPGSEAHRIETCGCLAQRVYEMVALKLSSTEGEAAKLSRAYSNLLRDVGAGDYQKELLRLCNDELARRAEGRKLTALLTRLSDKDAQVGVTAGRDRH